MSYSRLYSMLSILVVFALASGCGTRPANGPSASSQASHDAGHGEPGHVHDADGHDHDAGGHDHAELGPHGGQLIELGDEEYHAEILHDDNTHTVSVYVLDGKAEKTVDISAPSITIDVTAGGDSQRYTLTAVDLGQGGSSGSFCFESADEDLCHALDDEDSQSALNVNIKGESFTGKFAHVHDHDHDHHHDHAHAAHDGHRG